MNARFDITAAPLPNGARIEASAGTGKTHAVAAYVAREIATSEDLRIGEILVTTFTRNAAAELRDRIRGRLVVSAALLRGRPAPPGYRPDELDAMWEAADGKAALAGRLDRAAAEFDTAVIGTIHAVCARVLRLAGIEAADTGDEELLERVIEEVVNDAIVAEALAGRSWNEGSFRMLVRTKLGDPFLVDWFDPARRSTAETDLLEHLTDLLDRCVGRVRDRMRSSPSFDDLLVRAWEEVTVRPHDSLAVAARKRGVLGVLQGRFKLAVVDEAQDTNQLQWEFLHALFPPEGGRPLVTVGDPKQAIYRFRGADVTAYLARSGAGTAGAGTTRRTLAINRRSDGPLLDALNTTMAGASFGPGIDYHAVDPAPGRETARVTHVRPVEFLDAGERPLTSAAVRKIHELLSAPLFRPADSDAARPFLPGEVCVLVRSNRNAVAIAKRLAVLRIPAVTAGTASVMDGQMAADIRSLLEAMDRPGDAGRTRRAAATAFFGVPLVHVGALPDTEAQRIGESIAALHVLLQRRGVAAMAADIMNHAEIAARVVAGSTGERMTVDFAHVMELLDNAAGGKGCHARRLLEHFAALAAKDEKGDLVSRRVESDADAVRIMTVHAAKGLQFPCVIVVDSWKRKPAASLPAVFYDDASRRLDVGCAIPTAGTSDTAKQLVLRADNEELLRLIYVAVTRSQHHVCIVRDDRWQESLLAEAMPGAPVSAAAVAPHLASAMAVRGVDELSEPAPWTPPTDGPGPRELRLAPLPAAVEQTYRRTSFTDIAARAAHRGSDPHAAVGGAGDEEAGVGGESPRADTVTETIATGGDDVPEGDLSAIPDLPAGTAFGNVVHEIFERIETGPGMAFDAVADSVRRIVGEVAVGVALMPYRDALAAVVTAAVQTPFGGPGDAVYRDHCFADFGPQDRLAEMPFEMALAPLGDGVRAADIGRVLQSFLSPTDPLAGYAEQLAGAAFDVPLAGLISGSIDAVLRLPGHPADTPRLLIADYKTNRLHRREDVMPLAAYAPSRLTAAMESHHYPLQALVYGTAVWRMLRWRIGPSKPSGWDPGECIAGIVYGFVRGMRGAATPTDITGRRYGVFTWQPPPGIWRRLSDLLAGDRVGVFS